MKPKDNGALLITFDRFWVDLGADSLREDLAEGGSNGAGAARGCACLRLPAPACAWHCCSQCCPDRGIDSSS